MLLKMIQEFYIAHQAKPIGIIRFYLLVILKHNGS